MTWGIDNREATLGDVEQSKKKNACFAIYACEILRNKFPVVHARDLNKEKAASFKFSPFVGKIQRESCSPNELFIWLFCLIFTVENGIGWYSRDHILNNILLWPIFGILNSSSCHIDFSSIFDTFPWVFWMPKSDKLVLLWLSAFIHEYPFLLFEQRPLALFLHLVWRLRLHNCRDIWMLS